MDTSADYGAVREAAGIAKRTDRSLLRMWGRDPVKMLHGLITSDIQNAGPGRGVYGAMLTPKGKTIADLRAFRRETVDGTEVLFDVAHEALAGVTEHFKKFVPPMFAKWEDASAKWTMLGVYGPESGRIVQDLVETEPPEDEDAFVEAETPHGRLHVIRTGYVGEHGFDLLVPAEVGDEVHEALVESGARPIGPGTVETLRIEAGRPRYGADITEATIPTEAFESTGQMERAVSFTKGCYTGQEVIIRIAHRGRVNRHLRGLLLGDAAAPEPGAEFTHPESGKTMGWITSVTHSPRMAQTIALGYVRREREPGDGVLLDGREVTVTDLPFPEG